MSEADRIRWQCRRGLLELDLVLARFLDVHLENLSPEKLSIFRQLLDWPDNDLWDLVTGKVSPPNAETAGIIKLFE
ncbi:MAG TPA: succinate dehydrogenase assembly factor 2 [Burkholderiales bacterium]|nr:succinate dehydrogenase assembly factor 2 [Burkholderiales bacterium]